MRHQSIVSYLCRERFFSEVIVLQGDFARDPFGRVHDKQLLQEEKGFAVRLDPMPIHVLDQRAVLVAGTVSIGIVNAKKK